ncbi:MAG: hypothetical protein CMB55_07825 [Euryarchaeota archaeon]|nr:hypothetical protein [Euryarchaeota archaeon]
MGSFCKSGTKTNTQTTDIPDYIKTPLKENLAKAADLVKQEYIPYGGDRIEDFSQDQLDAFQQIRDRVGTGQTDLDAAMAGIKSLSPAQAQQTQARQFDAQTAQDYMNPYTQQVLDVARQRAFEAEDIAAQKRAANQVAAGAFGDNSRRFIENTEAQSNLQDRMAAMEADQLAKAYGAAQQAYKTDATLDMQSQLANQRAGLQADQLNTQQALGAAQGIAGLVNQGQGLTFDQANALMQIGGQQQQMGQAGLDLAYSDFQQQQAYPYQQIGFMADLLQGAPMGTVTTMTQPTPSPFQSALGLGLTGLGIYGSGGGFAPGGFSMANLYNQ